MIDLLNPSREHLLDKWATMVECLIPISEFDSVSELCWMAEAGAQLEKIVEIGSYKGKSTRAFTSRGEGSAIVYAIDDFRAGSEAEFMQNTEWGRKRGKIIAIKAESFLASHIIAEKFDLAFIDGDHLPNDVALDLLAWERKVERGGIVSGHDAYPNDPENGVIRALELLQKPYRIICDSIWAYRKEWD